MILASEMKGGTVFRSGGEMFRVVEATYHMGGGKAGGMVHAKLKNLKTGHFTERRFSPDEKIEDLVLERKNMEYLYNSGDDYYFMDSGTFEQISLSKTVIGPPVRYLKEGMKIPVELHEGVPVQIIFPAEVEIRIAQTGPGIKGGQDTTYKPATLENGLEVLVPQFIQSGDLIRVEVETGKYLERVRT
jgi:elongation factor P